MSKEKAKCDVRLLLTLEDRGDGACECHTEMQGTPNAIANAYEALTTEVINHFVERTGTEVAVSLLGMILEKAIAKSAIGEAMKGETDS